MHIQGNERQWSQLQKGRESEFAFVTKGEVGGWKSYFTPEMNERFDKELLAKLKGTGLEFDFEK